MTRPINWLLSPLSLLKLSSMVALLLIIVFFLDGRNQWFPYQLVFLLSVIFLIGTFLTLSIHYFDISRTNKQLPWHTLEMLFDTLGFLLCAGGALVLSYDWWELNRGRNKHHSQGPPITIGHSGWQRRVMVVIIVLALTALLFLSTLGRVKRAGLA